jgi:hypothetical protein
MKNSPSFITAQRSFVRYLRDPRHEAPPEGLSGERLEVYRYAVRHNVERFMADNFPRVRAALTADVWDDLVDCYLRDHPAQTAAFPRLPGEFLSFLTGRHAPASLPPQVPELAHFEWLENAVACDEQTVPVHGFDRKGDLLEHPVFINPVHRLASYRYAVHAAPPEALASAESVRETHLVVFRDAVHQLHVLELNAVTRTLFERLRDGPEMPVRQVLTELAQALGHSAPDMVLSGGLEILERMRHRGLVLGRRMI